MSETPGYRQGSSSGADPQRHWRNLQDARETLGVPLKNDKPRPFRQRRAGRAQADVLGAGDREIRGGIPRADGKLRAELKAADLTLLGG